MNKLAHILGLATVAAAAIVAIAVSGDASASTNKCEQVGSLAGAVMAARQEGESRDAVAGLFQAHDIKAGPVLLDGAYARDLRETSAGQQRIINRFATIWHAWCRLGEER